MPAAAEESRLALSAYVIHIKKYREKILWKIDKIMTILVRGLISFINNLLQTFR